MKRCTRDLRLVQWLFFGFGLEVDFAGFPFFGDFDEDAGHQAKQRGFVGEEADDAGAALDLRVERLEHVGGAQALAASRRRSRWSPSAGQAKIRAAIGNRGWRS